MFFSFTHLRIEDAQTGALCSFKTHPLMGVLNEQRCKARAVNTTPPATVSQFRYSMFRLPLVKKCESCPGHK